MEAAKLLDARVEYDKDSHIQLENAIKEFEAQHLLPGPEGHTPMNLLQYAMILMKGSHSRRQEAVNLLKKLLREQDPLDGTEDLTPEILYNLSLVLFSLQEYDASRGFCEDLVGISPDNRQFTDLHAAVVFRHKEQQRLERRKENEDMQNVGIAAGIGVAALFAIGAIASLAMKGKRR